MIERSNSKFEKIISENLPKGFEEQMSYGMIGFVVPHSIYPKGYHCTPELPLPFLSIASQKILSIFIIWEFMLMKITKMVSRRISEIF
jgi:hypothetical protein